MKIASKVRKAIMDRIFESWKRAEDKNLNEAYLLAFEIGLQSDIEEVLKEVD